MLVSGWSDNAAPEPRRSDRRQPMLYSAATGIIGMV